MRNRRGSALVTVLITVFVLVILGVAITGIAWQRMHLAVSYEYSNGALYAAEAGIEEMKLDINSKMLECKAYVNEQIKAYLESSDYNPDIDLNAEVRKMTKEFIFTNYLHSIDPGTGQPRIFHREFPENGSSYSIQFSNTDYDSSDSLADFIIVRSIGSYGSGSKSASRMVTARIRLLYGDDTQVELPGGKSSILVKYPAVIQKYSQEPFSLRANCKDFSVIGSFYLPKGVHDLGNLGSADFDFSSDFVVDDKLTLSGDHRKITVNKNVKVNGDLEFGTESNEMTLSVINGELVVNGNIYLNGQNNTILASGNVRCNGNIVVDSKAKVDFVINGNLYITGQIINNAGRQGNITVNGSINNGTYGGSIEPVNSSFGDTEVFSSAPGVDNISYIGRSYGSEDKPVVIFHDGDITIDMESESSIEINGIIYATGYVNIIGMKSDDKQFTIKGNIIAGKKLNIDGGHGKVTIQYDSTVFNEIDTAVVEYFGGSSTGVVYLPSNISVVSWQEQK